MNGAKENRYHSSFEKQSKKLRLLYPCQICGENNFLNKEVHHIDEDKKNGTPENLIVLCKECHFLLHQNKINIPDSLNHLRKKTIFLGTKKEWISKDSKIKVAIISSEIANNYRKQFVKGWIIPGSCNLYIGMIVDNVLCGVLGFQNPEMGNYDLLMKADTTDSNNKYSIDLLLYLLRTKDVQNIIEKKFNRKINTIYSMCFSPHSDISRYRKHGNLIKKIPSKDGFNISYLFKCGDFKSIKSAISEFFQKHKDI